MKLTVDISYYNSLTPAQWDILGLILDGVIIRLGYGITEDSAASKHVEQAKRVGLPYVGYIWVDPTWGMDAQLSNFKRLIEKHKPAGMFNDAEQYWRDWNAFMSGDYVKAYATRFSPSELNKYYKDFYDKTKDLITVGNYTGMWFMREYSPQMMEWVVPNNFWNAHYTLTTKTFKPSDVKAYASTMDVGSAIGRQFTDRLNVTGLPYKLDWNIFTDEGFNVMFKHGSHIPVEPPEEVMNTNATVLADVLNVRSSPEVNWFNKVGKFIKGERITIESQENHWGKVTYPINGYVSMGYVALDDTPVVDDKLVRLNELSRLEAFIAARKIEIG